MKKQKVIILGSSGFLGINITKALVKIKKFKLYGTYFRNKPNIKGVKFIKVDLTKEKNVTSIESGTGNYELIVLDKIENGETDLSNKSLKALFYNEQTNSILYSFIQSLREQAEIKIYTENL